MVGVVEKVVGGWRGGEGGWCCGEGGWWLALCGWCKITIAKEKHYLKDHSRVTRIIPFTHRWGNLSEHRLIDITDLGESFMVFCEFPQP